MAQGVLGTDKTGPIDWRAMENTREIRQTIAAVVPGYGEIGKIDDTKKEFQIEGRTFHTPQFPTPSGKAQLKSHELPELFGIADQRPADADGNGDARLRMMTVRSEGQFNTVVYEDYDLYRGIDRRDVIALHPDDIARLGLTADGRCHIHNEVGRMENVFVMAFDKIRPGNALMYYPEANVLVPRALDPSSKTPAFKCVLITVEPAAARKESRRSDLVELAAATGRQAGDGTVHARQNAC
jgi:anaerobic selenocysteine-containing dehydrogenase